jgi:hypothetical protein
MLGIEDLETKYAKMTPEEYQQYSEKPLKDEDIDVDEKNPKKRKRNIFGNFKQTLIEFMDDNDKEV